MKETRCLNCNGVLFRTRPEDDKGNRAVSDATPLKIEQNGVDSFITCPHCSRRNKVMTKETKSQTGAYQIEIQLISLL